MELLVSIAGDERFIAGGGGGGGGTESRATKADLFIDFDMETPSPESTVLSFIEPVFDWGGEGEWKEAGDEVGGGGGGEGE